MTCPSCGTENPDGKKFCSECGTPLRAACPNCGAPVGGDEKFCGECGTPLQAAALLRAAPAAAAPTAERRLVSVLFADLVGFTTLSEGRDPEEVRELLSRYFDTARRLVELYGGMVEKFIGDAVMAVWGVPAATEDDAERAVRTALDLVAAVGALGEEIGADLQARAGVLTGEAAVTLGATGQGMVAGDLVNTASRVQSAADPGRVLVGEATRRTSEQAIVYEPAGAFELKGKEGEVELWRALRVVSGRGGALKSAGLEAPFVGRDRELRQIKELFHVSAEEKRAQLVSVTGIAGIGKSRLVWEFYKYFDGIEQLIYWHRGRCLAYGEGVTYWALQEMVRMRCGIAEDDPAPVAEQKLRASLDEHLLDPEERRFVEPRLAQLLGLGDQAGVERQDLHGAWRLFFERLSDSYPTVLVFEDMQWADSSLLDFVEQLLDWSRNHPIYVLTLARPELLEKRQGWGAGQRHFTSLYLEPLSDEAMRDLLTGLVPGLPESVRARILARAEGVPLYAVETVRMLLDKGLLAAEGSSYRVVGEIETLAVPETLQALAAARLDGLSPEERRLVQDGAVLGRTFTPQALGSLAGVPATELEPLLAGLVRKELFGVQADPRSPEHGQYGFLQDLLRQVAYDTLSRHDRRAKHLAAADHLTATLGEDEVAEVIASHLLDAYRLAPDADDGAALREKARLALLAAAERAAALGATGEAQHLFEQAAELTDDPVKQAAALLEAGRMAMNAADDEHGKALLDRAVALYSDAGDRHGAARATGVRGQIEVRTGDYEQSAARLEEALETIRDDPADVVRTELVLRLAGSYFFSGEPERSVERIEEGLDLAEALQLPDQLCRGWTLKANRAQGRRPQEARALLELALETALENDLLDRAGVAAGNLSDFCFHRDRYADAVAYQEQALTLHRRVGNRVNEWFSLSEQTYALTMLGRFDEALAVLAEIPEDQLGLDTGLISPLTGILEIQIARGDLVAAQRLFARFESLRDTKDVQAQSTYHSGLSALRLAEGRHEEALAAAERAIAYRDFGGLSSQPVKQAYRHAFAAARALGRPETVERLLAAVDETAPGLRPPYLAALAHRYRAWLAGADPAADRHFTAAIAGFQAIDVPYDRAVTELEYAEWLDARGRPADAEPHRADAEGTLETLGATAPLERFARADRVPAGAGG